MNRLVIYHKMNAAAICNDGYAAALCAWMAFGDEDTEYYPAIHGLPAPDLAFYTNREVYFLDFVYPDREYMDQVAERASSLVVIDHHESAMRIYKDANYFVYRENRSACGIAWDWFKQSMRTNLGHYTDYPLMLVHIEDSDLWKYENPYTSSFIRSLSLVPVSFQSWFALLLKCRPQSTAYQKMITDGLLLIDYSTQHQSLVASSAFPIIIAGIEGMAVNYNGSSLDTGALGSMLADKCGTYGAVFSVLPTKTFVELRSKPTGTNVAILAEKFGGGGHAGAAGFRVPTSQLSFLVDIGRRINVDRIKQAIFKAIHEGKIRGLTDVREAVKFTLDTDPARSAFSYTVSVASAEGWSTRLMYWLVRSLNLPTYLPRGLKSLIFPYSQEDGIERVILEAKDMKGEDIVSRLLAASSLSVYKLRTYRCTVKVTLVNDAEETTLYFEV